MEPKITWQERVRDTEKHHKELIRNNPKHTIRDTAVLMKRSVGSITEDLMLANWLKTHPSIQKLPTMLKALEFVRAKKQEMRVR
jgi:hypothetical protein